MRRWQTDQENGIYLVEGPCRLRGEVRVQGAKNAALPILAAALLTPESIIHRCPRLSDIDAAADILRHFGCRCEWEGETLHITRGEMTGCEIPEHLMREMRSSIVFLGAAIARCGSARISMPGGCELGPRPIDMHLSALRRLGVRIEDDDGFLRCTASGGLRGARIALPFPSVGATENAMIAACLAEGETELHNAAREPEIADLAAFLNAAGAQIHIDASGSIFIRGVRALHACEHTVIPDRIVAVTYLCAAAATGSSLTLRGVETDHLAACLPLFEEMGCTIRQSRRDSTLSIAAPQEVSSLHMVRTMPYPGFPTDAQAPLMAVCCRAKGTSIFVENIFENRYKHAAELLRMGADIKVEGRVAVVEGVGKLHSARVECTDLRGGAAMVVAALGAQGETRIGQIRHIERGYETLDECLRTLGASIKKQ